MKFIFFLFFLTHAFAGERCQNQWDPARSLSRSSIKNTVRCLKQELFLAHSKNQGCGLPAKHLERLKLFFMSSKNPLSVCPKRGEEIIDAATGRISYGSAPLASNNHLDNVLIPSITFCVDTIKKSLSPIESQTSLSSDDRFRLQKSILIYTFIHEVVHFEDYHHGLVMDREVEKLMTCLKFENPYTIEPLRIYDPRTGQQMSRLSLAPWAQQLLGTHTQNESTSESY